MHRCLGFCFFSFFIFRFAFSFFIGMYYKAYIFDVDGVLVDTPHERAWADALNRLMAGPWAALARRIGYAPERFTSAFYQQHLAGKPRHAGAAAALAALGVDDPDGALTQQYAAAKQAYLRELIAAGDFARFADAERLLLRLKAAGVRLAAASSSQNANDFMDRIALPTGDTMRRIFDVNVCGRTFGQGKPHPAIFLAAAAELGLPPAACVVVEDAPAGVQAARAGGFTCIAVARLNDADRLRVAGADRVVTSLDLI
jgi:HAD superfamily hydrolase (TIGR01509 family)